MTNLQIEGVTLPSIAPVPDEITSGIIQNYKNIILASDAAIKTKETYLYNVRPFISFIGQYGLDRATLKKYKEVLRHRADITAKTKNSYLYAAVKLLSTVYEYGYLNKNMTETKGFKISKGHTKNGFNKMEIERIKEHILNIKSTKQRTKLYLQFCLMAFQGLRQIEVVRLRAKDLLLNDSTIHIQGKGSESLEPIKIGASTLEAFKEFIKVHNKKDGYLFAPSTRPHKQPSTYSIRKSFKSVLLETKTNHRVLHGFRHYFTTTLLEYFNGDPYSVKALTRHRSIETIAVYDDRRKGKALFDEVEKAGLFG